MKGNNLTWLPESLQQGIRLHRRIDSFTDAHAAITDLKKSFPRPIRRMSGVCIDIWFDHLLLCHHTEFSPSLQEGVFADFYQELATFELLSPTEQGTKVETLPFNSDHFHRVQKGLLAHQWLKNYRHHATCLQAFKSVEARLGHRILFAEQAFIFIESNPGLFEQVFAEFYPQLTEHAVSLSKGAIPKLAH